MTDLSREEFERWMEVLRDDVRGAHDRLRDDVRGVHDRLDALNGRTRKAEQAIAVLEDRGQRDMAARWTGIGSLIAAVGGFFWQRWFGA